MNPADRPGGIPALTRTDFNLAFGAGLAALLLYLRTLAPSMLMFDSGEFQYAVPTLTLAHPTGYPLYLLLGKLVTFIPLGDIAYRVNLYSALAESVAVALLVLVGVSVLPGSVLGRRLGALAAAALFAVAFDVWANSIVAEVYALHFALMTLLALAVFRRWPLPVLGLIAGLMLAHHRMSVLVLPVFGLYWLVLALRDAAPPGKAAIGERLRRALPWRQVGLGLLLGALPLLLYLYIPLRAPASTFLHQRTADGRQIVSYTNDFDGFVDQITGRVFANRFGSGRSDALESRWEFVWRLVERQWNLAVLALGVVGLVVLMVRRPAVGIVLWAVGIIAVLFGVAYGIADPEAYFIPAYWSLALGAGGLLATALSLWSLPIPATIGAGLVTILALALPPVERHFNTLDLSNEWAVRQRWQSIMAAPLERRAILASDDRDDLMPMWYLQLVEGVRPDLVAAFPGIVNQPEYGDLGRLIDTLLGPAEHIYLIKDMPGLDVKYRLEPYINVQGATGGLVGENKSQRAVPAPGSPLYRVVGPAAEGQPDQALDLNVGDSLHLDGVDVPTAPVTSTLQVRLWWSARQQPAANYTTFVHLVDWQGKLVAQSDGMPGGVFYPTSRWRPGERLVDRHVLTVPANLPAGRYALRAGAYDDDLTRLKIGDGDTADIGAVRITRAPEGTPANALNAHFAGVGTLEGATVGQDGMLALYWRADGPTDKPLTVFVHVLGPDGALVRQADGIPAGGALPTDSWLPSERLRDGRQLDVSGLPPGDYRVLVGLYDPATGQRRALDAGGDSVLAGTFQLP